METITQWRTAARDRTRATGADTALGREWEPDATRPRLASPWRSPTFYVALPLTLVLFACLFAARAVRRLRGMTRGR